MVEAAAEYHRMRHYELILAGVLSDQQRHVLLVEELEADVVEEAAERRLGVHLLALGRREAAEPLHMEGREQGERSGQRLGQVL